MNRYEQARRDRMARDPVLAAKWRAQNRAPRPSRAEGDKRLRARSGRAAPYNIMPIDGEGFAVNGQDIYGFLHIHARTPLISYDSPLSTRECLEYILSAPHDWALIGFALNYDVENWLRDLPDEDYLRLTNGGEEVEYEGISIHWIPSKMLALKRGRTYRVVYDNWGYHQGSLVSALARLAIPVPPSVEAGKAARGTWGPEDLQAVASYAREEARAMRGLFTSLRDTVNAGLSAAAAPYSLTRADFYGPGALARKALAHAHWTEEHPLCPWGMVPATYLESTGARRWDREQVRRFPFSAAYAAGRIECAAVGAWAAVEDHDLHSAYPCALSRLPAWSAEDYAWLGAAEASRAMHAETIGMYLVEWCYPEGWDWYPLPYRAANGNLYWPRTGAGFVMAPEILAAQGAGPVQVLGALVVRGTEGLGAGDDPLPPARLSKGARMIVDLYAQRESMIARGEGGQLALKLALNGMSGQLQRQVGRTPESPGLYSDLSSAWYTSWTRAQVWRAVEPWRNGHRVLSVQTDGICALPGLSPATGAGLGAWETAEWRTYRQFGAGLYDAAGLKSPRQRGFPGFEHDRAWRVVTGEQDLYSLAYRCFVGRRHAMAQPNAPCWIPTGPAPTCDGDPTTFGESRYQWRDAQRMYSPSLGSKRAEPWRRGLRASASREDVATVGSAWRRAHQGPWWSPPKENRDWEALGRWSQPYALHWAPAEAWVASGAAPPDVGDKITAAAEEAAASVE